MSATKTSPTGITPVNSSFFQRWLLGPKIVYFMLNMFVYSFHFTMPKYFMKNWGFKFHEYGFVSSITVMYFIGSLVWSSLADRTGKYRSIVCWCSAIYLCFTALLSYPIFTGPSEQLYRIFYVSSILAIGFFFQTAAFPLIDARVMGMLSEDPNATKETFGRQRLFGAFGHLITTLLSSHFEENYHVAGQIGYLIFTGIAFIATVLLLVPDGKAVKGGHHGSHGKGKGGEAVVVDSPIKTLLLNPSFMFFMILIMSAGILRCALTNFQGVFVMEALKIKITDSAVTQYTRTASEVLTYFFSKDLIRIFGVYWVLVFSQFCGIIRVIGYGLMNPSWKYALEYAMFLEGFKGFNSGLISASAIRIASDIAPAGCESSAQGLYSGNYSGLSSAVGGIASGLILWLYRDADRVMALQVMFNYTGVFAGIITLLFVLKYVFVDRTMGLPGYPRRYSHPNAK